KSIFCEPNDKASAIIHRQAYLMSVINGIHPSVNTVYICSKERSIDSPSMPKERVVLDSDLRYLDGKGVLLRTRTELTVARILSFLGRRYEYDSVVSLKDG